MRLLSCLRRSLVVALCAAAATAHASQPQLGGVSGTTVRGATAGDATQGSNSALTRCAEPYGTLAVEEDQSAVWFGQLVSYHLGSTIPVLRLLIQQSNCFVIVERSVSGTTMMQRERQLAQSGELRAGSSIGGGQMVAADYLMRPSVQFAQKGTGGVGGLLGAFGVVGAVAGAIVGGLKQNEAATTLLLVDNRSGVQISAAEGSAKNFDFAAGGFLFAGGLAGAGGAWSNTPEGKIITAAFADSFNKMVGALANYRAQTVRGGLGTGGRLQVDGAPPR
jgi:hypothetical protein